ncbi:MAG TPA: AzlC family ABC transporter permease [Thermoflexales bacterium]|nr:AzlC family ABC transporter permease [Thermoflexales bacterium]HQW34314.1 AzlC family ABC transporter permease [Thermoflexales bacterium]HQX76994.1 AzlC family ABC transporter permease [Thermoflexales bacterium]HQZ22085.1 AzlC family ABC transporter permease [Thermoflexales bacterium]HQZ99421.1 AzlC family ABC transporter permease [Thermoflexales bacterium]
MRRTEFMRGWRDELPILLGVLPFGVIYGALAIKAGLPPLMAQLMSCIVFAGSAQIIQTRLVAAGAPGLIMIVTGFVVNLRHALYSASVAPHVRHLSRPWKWLLAYLLTDEAYAVVITRYTSSERVPSPDFRHWYYFGAGMALWTTWQLSTAAGVFLGAQIPESWGLDFALPITFIAIVVPSLKDRAGMAAALVGGLVALAAFGLPLKLGLIVAAIFGILAGMIVSARRR